MHICLRCMAGGTLSARSWKRDRKSWRSEPKEHSGFGQFHEAAASEDQKVILGHGVHAWRSSRVLVEQQSTQICSYLLEVMCGSTMAQHQFIPVMTNLRVLHHVACHWAPHIPRSRPIRRAQRGDEWLHPLSLLEFLDKESDIFEDHFSGRFKTCQEGEARKLVCYLPQS